MKRTILTLLASLFLSEPTLADTIADFHGDLVAIPCHVNGNQDLDYNFGRVRIKKVDGVNYAINQSLKITCDKDINAKLQLEIDGATLTKSHVLKTSANNLGVALFNGDDDSPLPLNTPMYITKSTDFALKAIPVKDKDAQPLVVSSFTGIATVVAYYE
jgi:type 1 fimbria pilin